MVSQASFTIIFRQQFAGYLRLPTGLSGPWYYIYLPLRRQQSFTVPVFRAVGRSDFSRTDYSMSLRLRLQSFHSCELGKKKFFFHNTRREQWLGYCFSKNHTIFKEYNTNIFS